MGTFVEAVVPGVPAEAELCSLAKRIPKAKKGKTTAETAMFESRRANLVKCVQWLVTNEDRAGKMWELIENGHIKLDSELATDDKLFDKAQKTLNKTPQSFVARVLTRGARPDQSPKPMAHGPTTAAREGPYL